MSYGLLRSARNDETRILLVIARSVSDEATHNS